MLICKKKLQTLGKSSLTDLVKLVFIIQDRVHSLLTPVHSNYRVIFNQLTVDQGLFEFQPNRPLCRPLSCAASTGPTLSYAGSVSTLMARPDFLQYPAYHRPILPTPLAQFSVRESMQAVQFDYLRQNRTVQYAK